MTENGVFDATTEVFVARRCFWVRQGKHIHVKTELA